MKCTNKFAYFKKKPYLCSCKGFRNMKENMRVYPNAKVNLGLHVGGCREDGYHGIETLFYPVKGLYDVLDIEIDEQHNGPHIDLVVSGLGANCEMEKNLAWKAYRAVAKSRKGKVPAVQVRLQKNIPTGAGLGGGSADAAFMVKALNELASLGLSQSQMADIVRPLGADCPFFLYNEPCMATGIGDVLTPIDYDLSGKYMVMIKPPVSISTGAAYAAIDTWHAQEPQAATAPWKVDVNDFETVAFAQFPILSDIKQALYDAGAYYALMSGSGSTVYGLFETDAESRAFADLGRLENQFASMILFHDTLR